jgi:hypothetical protein
MMRESRVGAAYRRLGELRLPGWSVLVLLFVVCFYAFGVLLSRLGYFQDDWHHVFQAYWYGVAGLKRFLLVDRGPFSYLVYVAFFKILGFAPAHWHWSLMLVRFMTVAMFWLAVREIWPEQNGLTAWLALLFAVYPIFALQPLSVAYTLHWAMYFVFMLSLFLMLFGLRHMKTYVPLTLAAVVLEAVHLLCIEYFSGLEFSRPIFLWLYFSDLPPRERLKKTLKTSLPYLATVGLYAVYRSAYSKLYGFDRFGLLSTLTTLVQAPLSSIGRVVQFMVQDLVFVILSPWYPTVDPQVLDLSRASTYLIFGSVIAVGIAAYFVVSRLAADGSESGLSTLGKQLILAGILSATLALFPFWVAGLSIFQKNQLWSDRLALAAMPGASMMMTGAVAMLVDRRRYRNLLLSALVGLSISPAAQTARSYQASWDKQQQFYWQLHWRAPSLKPNTLLVTDQEILFFMGVYPTTFAVNVLYPQLEPWPKASYWFDAGTEHVSWDKFSAGEPAVFEKYTETFRATREGVLAIAFEPGLDQCLWVMRPEYVDLRDLSETAKGWLSVSDPAQIQPSPDSTPPPDIFGSEPARGWCYYYEKADLARQFQQWQTAINLWNQAEQNRLRPRNSIELLPFIEAYARSGDWKSAQKLTSQGEGLPDRSVSVSCNVWKELGATAAASAERDQTTAAVLAELGCQR